MKLRTFTALLLAAIMLFALTACGSQAADDSSSDQQQEQQDTTTNESNEFRVGMECAYAPNNWQESEATDSNVPVENAPGYLASNPDFRPITFSEGSGFTLPAKGSCVGLRKSDTALLEQINEILGTLDNATRDEMWQTAVDNQPQ